MHNSSVMSRFRDVLVGPFDEDAWGRLLDASCHLRLGNRPPSVGKAACLAELLGLYGSIEAIGCDYWDVRHADEVWFIETDMAMRDTGMFVRRLPCALAVRFRDRQIIDLRIYADIGITE